MFCIRVYVYLSLTSKSETHCAAGGAELYDAACRLREALRGRAILLIEDRTDIVDAAEADGVVLSQRGVPEHDVVFLQCACPWGHLNRRCADNKNASFLTAWRSMQRSCGMDATCIKSEDLSDQHCHYIRQSLLVLGDTAYVVVGHTAPKPP